MERSAFRRHDGHNCPSHGTGPIEGPAAGTVLINGVEAAHLADFAGCPSSGADVISEGAATVWIEQLPAGGLFHGTIHGGHLQGACSPDVFVGGMTFRVPPCVTIEGDAEFQNKVLRDLWVISCTDTGNEIFDRLVASGKHVTIVPGDKNECGPTVADVFDSEKDTVVSYNPDRAGTHLSKDGDLITSPPQVGLVHELVHSVHFAEGDRKPVGQVDPAPPITEPEIEEEEAATIGTGSHSDDFPTENSVRREWGMPERIDHGGYSAVGEGSGPKNRRPGKY